MSVSQSDEGSVAGHCPLRRLVLWTELMRTGHSQHGLKSTFTIVMSETLANHSA